MNHSTFQRKAMFAGIVSATALVMTGNTAIAQSSVTSLGIEEMVVTAQKREENLQAVPISISSLSANDIERRGVQNPRDLLATMPNMSGFEPPGGKGSMSISMRGVSAGSPSNMSIDTTTAIYIDGVIVGKMVGAASDVAELERVEVLRGPQGTLYGRNSTGGAVNFITRKPTGEFGGKITGTVGNKDLWSVRATLDTPTLGVEGEGLGTLKASFGAQTRKRDGFQKNTTSVQDDFDNLDRQAGRIALRWEPTDAVTVDYAYDRSKLDESNPMQSIFGLTPLALAIDPVTNGIAATVDRLAALGGYAQAGDAAMDWGAGPLGVAASDPTFMRWLDSVRLTQDQLSNLNRQGKRPSKGAADSRTNTTNDAKGHSLTVAWQFDDLGVLGDVEFKSISGWRKVKTHNIGDLDGLNNTIAPGAAGAVNDSTLGALYKLYASQGTVDPAYIPYIQAGTAKVWSLIDQYGAGGFIQDARFRMKQFSEELQMVGSTERLEYAVGLYYYKDEGEFRNYRLAAVPVGGIMSTDYDNETEAKALYMQYTYTPPILDDRLAITLGYRHTEETKKVKYLYLDDGASIGAGLFTPAGVNLAYTGELGPMSFYGRKFDKDFKNDSGSLTLAYQFTDDTNVFLRYSTGYRSGGYNGEIYLPDTPDKPFKEETMEQWELGIKSDIVPGTLRVNASVFQMTIEDMQTSQIQVSPTGQLTSFIGNAGEAERWGTELELQWSPTDNLLVSASWAHMSGDFEKYPELCGSGVFAKGEAREVCISTTKLAKRPQSPKDQLSLVTDWVFASTDWADFMAHLEIFWQAKQGTAALWTANYAVNEGTPPAQVGTYPYIYDQVWLKSRTVVNARIGMENVEFSNGSSLRASLWVRNAFDKDYQTFGMSFGSLGPILEQYAEPRTYGLDVIWEF